MQRITEDLIMSSKMSDDPQPSNPFETLLSDDPILHICSFLRGKDLLKLSTVDKNFRRIITESTETISKIPLRLDLKKNHDLDLDFAIKLAQTRRFTALKLYAHDELPDFNDNVKLISLLELLSGSVDDLTVWAWDRIPQEFLSLSTIIAMFLPNLKKCRLEEVFDAEDVPTIEGIAQQSSVIVNHPLETLELSGTHASKVLQFFTGCNHLKTFCYKMDPEENATTEDIEQVNKFLATQNRLEKLKYGAEGFECDQLTCFQLKKLKVDPLIGTNNQLATAEYLKKLLNLAKLDLGVRNLTRNLMRQICRVPKLKKFSIRTWKDEDDDGDSLEGLVNHTVKQLHIEDHSDFTSKLLKIFLGVESVCLCVCPGPNLDIVIDLSDAPCETIDKIEVSKYCDTFVAKFSPSELPTNVEQFESTVMEFAEEFSTVVTGIEIGHESWRNSGAFRLSNSFCEGLVNQLPKLVKLEVFNIADRGRFIAFLGENDEQLILEGVKLHEPFGAGEPKPKKMKIESD